MKRIKAPHRSWFVLLALVIVLTNDISRLLEVDAIVVPHHTRRKQQIEELNDPNRKDEKSQPIKLLLSPPGSGDGIPQSEITTHPLDPLTFSEIRLAAFMIASFRGYTRWIYKGMALKEPTKSELLPFFVKNDDIGAGAAGVICRRVWVLLQHPETNEFFEAVVNLNKLTLDMWKEHGESDKPSMLTVNDVVRAEDIALENPEVLRRIHNLGYNASQVVFDTWDAGYVEDNPYYSKSKQLFQLYAYAIESEGDNFYAHPFDFSVYVDVIAKTVRGIDNLPSMVGFSKVTPKWGSSVPKLQANYLPRAINSIKINSSNILMNMADQGKLNPIKCEQPGGASFKVEGRQIKWDKFIMRVGYNAREGLVLHHVKYNDNGKLRPIIYRASMSEIFVMYGDPRPNFHRKMSFDEGQFHLGLSATADLPKDIFCTGNSVLMDMIYADESGHPFILKNAICIAEEDDGPLWAHYDRSQEQVAAARSQRLSVGFLASIGHSDYWITWKFYPDATIELSVKLTGLKSTHLMAPDVKSPPYGNLMAPQVYAQINQCFFSARIDADVDSEKNAVVMEDILPVEGEVGSKTNPYGNGIMRKDTLLKTAEQAVTNTSPRTGRTWKIVNLEKLHSVTKAPVSWKLVPKGDFIPLLLKRNSPLRSNTTTAWADHNVWVLPFNDDQIYASGLFMKSDGLKDWVDADATASVVDKDIVLWHVFSLTNNPVAENWPVTSDSQRNTGFILKPNYFFDKNPALD